MTFETAKKLLSVCVREELRDHAFGDCEIYWIDYNIPSDDWHYNGRSGTERGFCYLSDRYPVAVDVVHPDDGHRELVDRRRAVFRGEDARALLACGKPHIERNDSTGPDDFVVGHIDPGLTLEAVLNEISTPRKEES